MFDLNNMFVNNMVTNNLFVYNMIVSMQHVLKQLVKTSSTFIVISNRQRYTFSTSRLFSRLFTLTYKRLDKAGKGLRKISGSPV